MTRDTRRPLPRTTDDHLLVLRGRLDQVSVAMLTVSVQRALLSSSASSLEVDLRQVEEWTTDGVRALAALVHATPGVRFRMGARDR